MKVSMIRKLAAVLAISAVSAVSAQSVIAKEATVIRVTEQRVVDTEAYGGDTTAAFGQALYFAGSGQIRAVPTKMVQTIRARTPEGNVVHLTAGADAQVTRGATVRYDPVSKKLVG